MRRFVIASALALCALPVFAGVTSIKLDPAVIRTNRVDPVAITVAIAPPAATGRIDLIPSGTVPLTTADGGTTWTGSIAVAQLLAGYAPDDVNRNLFGKLRLLDANGADIDGQRQLTIGVLDASTDTAPMTMVSTLRVNANVVGMHMATLANPTSKEAVQAIATKFFATYSDAYDFLNIVYLLPEYPANRDHFRTKNEVQGIGIPLSNDDALYGSAGKLQGITRYPIGASNFDMGEPGSLHEIGHQWINFLAIPLVSGAGPHWPPSQLAHNLMGVTISLGVGGDYNWKYVQQPDGSYKFMSETRLDEFNDVDLYLMGMLDASAVVPQLVLGSPNQFHCHNCTITGSLIPFGASNIVAQHGPRVPSAATAQKSFRVGTIVVTRDRVLNADELQFFAMFAQRASATVAQPYSVGLSKGTAKPFRLATRNAGSLDAQLVNAGNFPQITSVQPRVGPAGTSVTISGMGFSTSATVVIGTQAVTPTSISSTSITALVPAGTAGKLDVIVRQSSGLASWPAVFTRQ